jgi:Lon protease-like protein
MRIEDLPLFPLHVVLFPGMVLPLHIFEERYKLMISACLADDPRFGVALISEGAEVGGGAKAHPVGTVARIVSVGRYDGGQMDIITVGVQRFRIVETNDELPYLRASVELFRDDAEDPEKLGARARATLALLKRYQATLGQAGEEAPELPQDAESLSHVAGVLDLPLEEKQRLLESTSTLGRLERLEEFLRGELRVLSVLGETKPYKATRRFSSN